MRVEVGEHGVDRTLIGDRHDARVELSECAFVLAAPEESFQPGSTWRAVSIAGTKYVLARGDGLSGTWVG